MPGELEAPSPFVVAQEARLREAARLGPLLDLACGRGRHARLLARWGLAVVGLDRDADALRELAGRARAEALSVAALRADAESPLGLPLRAERFGAVLVARFLFRPLAPLLETLLRPGGLLVYETFTERQREAGLHPRNPAFLLRERELASLFPGLELVEYAEGLRDRPAREWIASLVARRPALPRR